MLREFGGDLKGKGKGTNGMSTVTTSEYLKYTFSEEEQRKNAQTLARTVSALGEAELRKKSLTAAIDQDIKTCKLEITKLSRWVNDGYDFRNVECEVVFHTPKQGMKTVVRRDTGEEVNVGKMSDWECQQNLFEDPPAAEPEVIAAASAPPEATTAVAGD